MSYNDTIYWIIEITQRFVAHRAPLILLAVCFKRRCRLRQQSKPCALTCETHKNEETLLPSSP